MIRGVRGATTLREDSPAAMQEALLPLLKTMVEQNEIAFEAISTVFYTVTPDLTHASAPQTARQGMGWKDVPLMCALEPVVEGFPERCVRVLIQFETTKSQAELQHFYQNEAARLRPDLKGD